METSPEWQPVIESIISDPGVVVVIGAVDAGKTTFCRQLANAGIRAGLPTAVVDSDVGQSEIGPPTTVGMALVPEPVEHLQELPPKRMYFVGATTPVNHLLQVTVGVKRMTDEAIALGSKLVVVDTSGLIRGSLGRTLKTQKVEAIVPKHIVGIRKGVELDPLLTCFSKLDKIRLHRVDSSPLARSKPQDYRSRRRQALFFKHFKNAERHIIYLDQSVCWNTWFSTGRTLKWQYKRRVDEALRSKVLHAEVIGKGLYLVTEADFFRPGIEYLREMFKTKDISVVRASAFRNVLVGLLDGRLNCIDIGIIEAVDFSQRYLAVISPVKTISPVRVVAFGSMRVRPDGVEAGRIQPGEV